jgi:hypothetical protein
MRMVWALICVAALSSMFAGAASAHAWLGRAALGVGRGSELVDSDSSRKSKLPCNSEHPPSYCKPKSGSGS